MIPSEEGEDALKRLGDLKTFLEHAYSSLATAPTGSRLGPDETLQPGRLSPSPTTYVADEERRTLCELALVRVVSIIENFVLELGRHEIEGRLATATVPAAFKPLVDHLREFRWEAVTGSGSWVKPLKLWDDALGVKAATAFGHWQGLEFVRTTRNVIVHRLGSADKKWFDTAQSLKLLSVQKGTVAGAGGRIPVARRHVDYGVDVAREFVFWLDSQRQIV